MLEREGALRITRRDVQVLEDLRLSTVIGINQLVDLGYFEGISRARRRMAALESRGYVRRMYLAGGHQNASSVFAIGPAAAPLLAQALGHDSSVISRQASRPFGRILVEHSLDVIRARHALIRDPHTLGIEFFQEPLVRHEFRTGTGPDSKLHVFKPDGLFRIRAGDRASACFLELDRGSCSLGKWDAGAKSYATYVRLGLFAAEYGRDFPLVLAITTAGRSRIAHLSRVAAASGGIPFWFSTLGQVEKEGAGGRIWNRSSTHDPRSLIEVAEGGGRC